MRRAVALGLVALSLCGGGCTLVHDATCLTVYKMREAVRDCHEGVRDRAWADHAWAQVRRECPKGAYSHDYAQGFKDGYAHYLFRGGNGEPPPLPPRHYRALRYQTPEGYQAIEDWFAGFRHGAGVAQHSGHRRWITGPSSLAGAEIPGPIPVVEPAAYGPALPPAEVIVPPPAGQPERLGAPRVVPGEPLPGGTISVKPLIDMYPGATRRPPT
jgi:hypothetical protein